MDHSSGIAGVHFFTEFNQWLVKPVFGCVDVVLITFDFEITRDLGRTETVR
jgi:hypothetical protein